MHSRPPSAYSLLVLVGILGLLVAAAAHAEVATLTNGGFELGTEDQFTGWTNGNAVAREHPGLLPGSDRAAFITSPFDRSGGTVLAQSVDTDGRPWWQLDCVFAMEYGSGNSLQLTFETQGINGVPNLTAFGNGSLNLRNPNGFSPVWVNIAPASFIAESIDQNGDDDFVDDGDVLNVHRLRVVGHDWGTADARYDVYLSEPNVLDGTFAIAALGNTVFQGPPPAVPARDSITAIRFQGGFSRNAYAVDSVDFAVPEPASFSLLGLGTLGLIARRRRR
ncbi:MAG: PEP-CTERM sorting domain-containing protein [Planctomycetota bacterium]